MRALTALTCALLLTLAVSRSAASIVIVNTDGAGEGFNDPTPAAPVGGNSGTTVGQQRLNVFLRAAQVWDAILQSPVQIRINSSFDVLSCTSTTAVLGSAGPTEVFRDFAGATFASTWYVPAEADRLTGSDLDPGFGDITARFNSNIGTATCLTGRNWYYGFDGNEGATGIDLLPVLLHEFGHGLGFLSVTSSSSGLEISGLPGVFDRFLLDNVTGKHWNQMTDAERVASAINTNHLVWDGPAVRAAAPLALGKRPHVQLTGALVADDFAGQATFGAALNTTGVSGDLVLVNDNVAPTSDGCETPYLNAAALAGKIAVIDRGLCAFAVKALNAQNAGAIAVLIVNNAAGAAPALGGSDPSVTIPVASVSQGDGATIKTAMLGGTVRATIGLDPAHLAGADDAGRLLMYSPNPLQSGSSVSHWDVSAFPNLLMEPAINSDLSTNLDLTYHSFFDMGWFPQLVSTEPTLTTTASFAAAPNPSRGGGALRFRLPSAGRVQVTLFDLAGRQVARIASGRFAAGEHSVNWDRRDSGGHRVAPGVYLARLKSGSFERTLHMVLLD